jgi:hypothetical protein
VRVVKDVLVSTLVVYDTLRVVKVTISMVDAGVSAHRGTSNSISNCCLLFKRFSRGDRRALGAAAFVGPGMQVRVVVVVEMMFL